MEDLRVLFFLHMVESLLLTITGLRLFDCRINAKTLGVISAVHGVGVWVVRGIYHSYNIPLGTHTLILTFFLIVLIRLIAKVDWGKAFGATLVSTSLIIIGSSVTGLVMALFRIDVLYIMNNPWIHVLLGYTENVFLVLFLLINWIFGFSIARSIRL